MATKKILDKQLILVANLTGLPEKEFKTNAKAIVTAVANNPDYVPNINPSPSEVEADLSILNDYYALRRELNNSQKANTNKINKCIRKIGNTITNKWISQMQNAPGMTAARAKRLCIGIKGVDNGKSENVVGKASNSHPIISKIDANQHLQHTLTFINSNSAKKRVPKDATQIDIYMQIGGEAPNDIKKMQYAGMTKNTTFQYNFDSSDLHKIVYYIAVYVNRKTLKPMFYSPITIAMVP